MWMVDSSTGSRGAGSSPLDCAGMAETLSLCLSTARAKRPCCLGRAARAALSPQSEGMLSAGIRISECALFIHSHSRAGLHKTSPLIAELDAGLHMCG